MGYWSGGGDGAGTLTALLVRSAGRDEMITRISFMDLARALDLASLEAVPLMQMPDFKASYRAFVEKRPAKFNRS